MVVPDEAEHHCAGRRAGESHRRPPGHVDQRPAAQQLCMIAAHEARYEQAREDLYDR
jgi:hypothetical protein